MISQYSQQVSYSQIGSRQGFVSVWFSDADYAGDIPGF